jgi:hypothetical protein
LPKLLRRKVFPFGGTAAFCRLRAGERRSRAALHGTAVTIVQKADEDCFDTDL